MKKIEKSKGAQKGIAKKGELARTKGNSILSRVPRHTAYTNAKENPSRSNLPRLRNSKLNSKVKPLIRREHLCDRIVTGPNDRQTVGRDGARCPSEFSIFAAHSLCDSFHLLNVEFSLDIGRNPIPGCCAKILSENRFRINTEK